MTQEITPEIVKALLNKDMHYHDSEGLNNLADLILSAPAIAQAYLDLAERYQQLEAENAALKAELAEQQTRIKKI